MQERKLKLLKVIEWTRSHLDQLEQLILTIETSEHPEELEEEVTVIYILVDIIRTYFNKSDSSPIGAEPTEKLKQLIDVPWLKNGTDLLTIYEEKIKKFLAPFNQGNDDPRNFSYIQGGGFLTGAMADFIAALYNPNVSIGNHAARYIDAQVVEWMKASFNFPKSSSGVLVTGSSTANSNAIFTAINYYRKMYPNNKEKLRAYCSTETHKCIYKPFNIINGDTSFLKEIEVNKEFEIDCRVLEKNIKEDIKAGYIPFLLIVNVGTVNTGAIDSLTELIAIKKKYKMWLHIDGAYGAPAMLTSNFKKQLDFFNQVDSLAFDFHKLFNINYAAGCVLIRNKNIVIETFKTKEQPYLMNNIDGVEEDIPTTDSHTLEMTRAFNALKISIIFENKGRSAFIEIINSRINLAK